MSTASRFLYLAAVLAILAISACGGGGAPPGGSAAPGPLLVTVSPLVVSVQLGTQRQFTATLTGGDAAQQSAGVSWSVAGAGNGSVDSAGLYSAPLGMPANPNVVLTATSVADPSKSANANITLSTAPIYGALPVLFSVKTQNGWQALQAPVTAGIPLPKGLHSNVNQLRIQRQAGGANVPAQFEVTSRWADGSIRWVLCDFIADLSGAGGVGLYQLNNGGTGSATGTSLSVTNAAADITVSTGPLVFKLSKTGFRLFESVLIDRDNDTQVDDECLNTAALKGVVVSEGVNEFTMNQLAPTRIAVEQSGPIRATIVAEGVHRNTTLGQNKLAWVVRITAWNGQPHVRVSYSFKNLDGHGTPAGTPAAAAAQLASYQAADSVLLDLPLTPSAATVAAQMCGDSFPPSVASLGAGQFVDLYQSYTGTHDATDADNPQPAGYSVGTGDGSSDPLTDCWPTQSDSLITAALTGQVTQSLNHCKGWMQMAGSNLRVTASLRDFWQLYPKQLRMQGDGLMRIGIWPDAAPALQVFAGAMKSHDMMFSFERSSSTSVATADVYGSILNDPPVAVCAPKHNAASLVYGQIGVTDELLTSTTEFTGTGAPFAATYMAEAVAHLGDLLVDRNDGNGTATGHQYGMWNFGDGKTAVGATGWDNNEWDVAQTCFHWFAASGNLGLWRFGESSARHFRDVVVLHADIGLRFDYTEAGNPAVAGGKASQLGKTRYTPNNKQHDLGNYHLGENHLDVFRAACLAEHYLLTGDSLSLDVLKECFHYLRGTWKRFFDAANGGTDSTMICPTTWLSGGLMVASAYVMANGLNDPNAATTAAFVWNAVKVRQDTVSPRDPSGNGFSDSAGDFKAWPLGHLLQAMEYARWALDDASIDDNIERAMNWLLGTNAGVYLGNLPTPQYGKFSELPGGTTDYGAPNLMLGAGYVGVWRKSGTAAWRTRAENLLSAQDPNIASGTVGDAGIRTSTFAQFFRSGPLLLGTLRQ
ncbi:MAG: hypothetical protein IT463_14045 [Planctomycetes bacterium]|nr:hypothetical protein [Planctomycetota bacterium]